MQEDRSRTGFRFVPWDRVREESRFAGGASAGLRFGRVGTALRRMRAAVARAVRATRGQDTTAGENRAWPAYAVAAGSSLAVALIGTSLLGVFDLTNIVMLFLLAVVLVAARFGRRAAMATVFLNVVVFDFFFVPPRFSLLVNDAEYLLTFLIMMIVGWVVGQLTASLRHQAHAAHQRERRALIHFELAQALGNAKSKLEALEIGKRTVETAFNCRTELLLTDAQSRLAPMGSLRLPLSEVDLQLARSAFDGGDPVGRGTTGHRTARRVYVPLRAASGTEGVLVVAAGDSKALDGPEQFRLLLTFAGMMAGATERLHLLEVARQAQMAVESERLRNSILAALSHDLRTPLTALIGLSELLAQALTREGSSQVVPATSLTRRLVGVSALVSNLLDMARLQAGDLSLRCDWESLEEIADGAIRSVEDALTKHPLRLRLPESLPLVYGDAVLLERVLANLFENAAKYTPEGTEICLTAWRAGNDIRVEVSDAGPGLPAGDAEVLFDKFKRGQRESCTSGVGLGLSICRAIVRAHGGDITAENRRAPERGAVLTWTLPYRDAPGFNDRGSDVAEACTADIVACGAA